MNTPPRSAIAHVRLFASAAIVLVLVAAYFFMRGQGRHSLRFARVMAWLTDPGAHPDWTMQAGQRCEGAPFLFPTNGFAGFLWGDSFRLGHRHQGVDIFGGEDLGQTPVVAAYGGYLTRLPDWKASLIVRLADDPLDPGRQIWVYYTHMADSQGNSFISSDYPPGTQEVYVEAGTLLGYQGNYSGDPNNPTGVHLHFSIVQDDGSGRFRNELNIDNTLDPSPYLGLPLNAERNEGQIPVCLYTPPD
jgi:murein DD-endopeptidase MepM/ murein hydrolase activator NlpD